ncbi:MAG: type II toxin-antitoxin system HicB family antitoxin [Fulvivirga sp.]|uniref:type II toxin-antitoxin system HicB family antitoxin n=1 Tax=Fulvivirga sp. TaxID=1931237 RepID=UPI0032EC5CFC
MRYLVIIEQSDNGFSAHVPDLPGCISVGNTREEVENTIQEAILFHIEGLVEDGEEIPTPKSEGVTLLVPKVA